MCGQSKDCMSLLGVKRSHTFLRWQQYSQSKICRWLSCQFAFAINPHESALSNEPQSRTNVSLVCRPSKTSGCDVRFGADTRSGAF